MRGKAAGVAKCSPEDRITPAYAGKRRFAVAVLKLSQDHPRLCGEKFSSVTSPAAVIGSPPPMRGKATAG